MVITLSQNRLFNSYEPVLLWKTYIFVYPCAVRKETVYYSRKRDFA